MNLVVPRAIDAHRPRLMDEHLESGCRVKPARCVILRVRDDVHLPDVARRARELERARQQRTCDAATAPFAGPEDCKMLQVQTS